MRQKYKRFPLLICFSLLGLFCAFLYLMGQLGSISAKDQRVYHQLMLSVEGDTAPELYFPSTQQRIGVRKDVHFYSDANQQHLKLLGVSSKLHLQRNERSVDLVESIKGVKCYFQEQTEGCAHSLLFLDAESADYSYKTETLTAENVKIERSYATSLERGVAQLQLTGSAKKICFLHQGPSTSSQGIYFEAEQLKAVLNPEKIKHKKESSALYVSAEHADFKDERIKLIGCATLEHALGSFNSHEMLLFLNPFPLIPHCRVLQLDGAANIVLKDVGQLNAAHVEITFIELSQPHISEPALVEEKYCIERMVAESDVLIHYGTEYTISGDRAVYSIGTELHAQHAVGAFLGEIQLYGLERLCQVEDGTGNVVYAPRIALDASNGRLILYQPKGKFQTGLGSIETDQEIRIDQTLVDGKKVLHKVESEGNTLMIYLDPEKRLSHSLQCEGKVKIDHQKLEMRLHASQKEGKQVLFKDDLGEVCADKALIKYQYVQGKVIPEQLSLSGNVKICNRFSKTNTLRAVHQLSLADRVDFYPQRHEMHLKASSGKRVVLYDRENDLEVSAPGIKVFRDASSGKECIQGEGDVRFMLTTDEFERLRQKFTIGSALTNEES